MSPSNRLILVIDPDGGARAWLGAELAARGVRWRGAASIAEAASALDARSNAEGELDCAAVWIDVADPHDAAKRVAELAPDVPWVGMRAAARPAHIVATLRAGARDFLPKPCDARELERVLAKLERSTRSPKGAGGAPRLTPASERGAVGPRGADPLSSLFSTLERVAPTDVTVLITGESGSGKEFIADHVHACSQRAGRPFVKVNCAALPACLLESELFGYEKGAFTGAEARKPGKFELAHRGTLFLDEISEMSPALQAKLLQVLQENRFARLGGERDVEVDVRILAATHRDLRRDVDAGRFRQDLYYRLNVVHLRVPSLRERAGEIRELADVLLRRACGEVGREYAPLPERLVEAFEGYAWPGNVRELENMLKRWTVLRSEASILDYLARQSEQLERREQETRSAAARTGEPGCLGRFLAGETESVSLRAVAKEAIARAERRAIERVLAHTRWNRRRAAELLHVSYKALLYKMKDAGLSSDA